MSTSPTDEKRSPSAANAVIHSTNGGNYGMFRFPLPPEPRVPENSSRSSTPGNAVSNSSFNHVGTSSTKESGSSSSCSSSSSNVFKKPWPVDRTRYPVCRVAPSDLKTSSKDSQSVQSSSVHSEHVTASTYKVSPEMLLEQPATSNATGSSTSQDMNHMVNPALPVEGSLFNVIEKKIEKKVKLKLLSEEEKDQIHQEVSMCVAGRSLTSSDQIIVEGLLLMQAHTLPHSGIIELTEKVGADPRNKTQYYARIRELLKDPANIASLDPNAVSWTEEITAPAPQLSHNSSSEMPQPQVDRNSQVLEQSLTVSPVSSFDGSRVFGEKLQNGQTMNYELKAQQSFTNLRFENAQVGEKNLVVNQNRSQSNRSVQKRNYDELDAKKHTTENKPTVASSSRSTPSSSSRQNNHAYYEPIVNYNAKPTKHDLAVREMNFKSTIDQVQDFIQVIVDQRNEASSSNIFAAPLATTTRIAETQLNPQENSDDDEKIVVD